MNIFEKYFGRKRSQPLVQGKLPTAGEAGGMFVSQHSFLVVKRPSLVHSFIK